MLNKVILMGRLTTNPELKKTPAGVSVTSLSLAVERSYKDKNGDKATDFITVIAWRNTAEFICKYFAKGYMIAVCGELQTRKYQAKDGTNRYVTEVVANEVSFTGEKHDNQGSQPAAAQQPTQQPVQQLPVQHQTSDEGFINEPMLTDDDLPF